MDGVEVMRRIKKLDPDIEVSIVTAYAAVESAQEARETLREVAEHDFAIIFITESLAKETYDLISDLHEATFPAICIIPEPVGASGFAARTIKDAMLRAVGTDVTANH